MTIDYNILVTAKEKNRGEIEQTIFETFFKIDELYNKWNPQSELSRFNESTEGDFPKLEPFLRQVNDYVHLTSSRFDPTIEAIQRVWKKEGVPEGEALEKAKEATGWHHIVFEENTLKKNHPLTAVDLGGVAKGFAVDLIAEALLKKGFQNGLVEWGGELRAFGSHPEKRAWSVCICRPGDRNPSNAIDIVPLKDASLATSGDYEQNFSINGETFTHIFSAKEGAPLKIKKGSIASVSIKAASCALADAIATAAMVEGCEEGAIAFLEEVKMKIPDMEYWIVVR